MTRLAASADEPRLLHASPERVVHVVRESPGGRRVVRKLVVSGSLADAEREVALGQLAAGPGVVAYLGATLDPASHRPCLTTEYVDGQDLDQIVAERGALPAAFACRLLAPAATTLARLHALRAPAAPHGLAHGDVKPRNLLWTGTDTLLLDFEHAAAQTPSSADGTDAAPPAGLRPSAADDVFGLGRTLRWLLGGGIDCPLPQHPDLERLLAVLLEPSPERRPRAAEVAATLASLAERLEDDTDEAALDALARGAKVAAGVARPGVRRWQRRAQRLQARLPQLLVVPSAVPTEPAALCRELRTAARVLRRFPRHAPTLQWRQTLGRAAGRLLAAAAERTAALRRSEEFDVAAHWLRDAGHLARDWLELPGAGTLPTDATATPTALHRDPIAFLQQLGHEVAIARADLAAETAAILAAQARLDLDGAARAIDAMAERWGGASPTATRQRDQLHRLSFYLERIARSQPNVERVAAAWDAVALVPVTELVAAAATAIQGRARRETATGIVGLRSLQITLVNLAQEFPHLPQVPPAHEALAHALVDLTDRAWQELDATRTLLRSEPVPVRPLQAALARLDTLRILDAFVDRPERARSQLQDAIEALRLRLDQARATRDRLAEGAENALARGHWTTGLFDMERAVAGLNPVDDQERAEAERLQERLTEARRRRQEIDAAVRRNAELLARYARLQDEPTSSSADRLQALAARRDCLHLLAMHVPADRAALYTRDLRDVETQIALEQAGAAEQQLDAATDPFERAHLARAGVDQILAAVNIASQAAPAPGRLLRLLEHWQRLAAQAQQAVAQRQAEQNAARRRRRQRVGLAIAGVAAMAALLLVPPWHRADAASAQPGGADRGRTGRSDSAPAWHHLPPALQPAAAALGAAAEQPATATDFDPAVWRPRFEASLREFCLAADLEGNAAPARTFAIACWDRALAVLGPRLDERAAADLPAWTAALEHELEPLGVRPSRR
ncbi:MAG: hypothetical protein KF830_02865 [Planctomycetes bacterium]|nr:hypothetical protein [Planctomycetota bacterium]